MLADLTRDDLEVWGFDGVPSVACSTSLPIVRHKPSDRFCALSVARRGGPGWSSRGEIEEHLRGGRLTRLTTPLVLPEILFPLTPAGQPLVAWAKPDFWWSILPKRDEDSISFHTGGLGWKPQTVEAATDPPTGNTHAQTALKRTRLWLACSTKPYVEGDLDGWAEVCLERYDERLVVATPNWSGFEMLADHGLCAARAPGLRYFLYVRYGSAMYYYRGSSQAVGPLERCTQLFRVIVKSEFPTVDWERFRADMAAVVNRSRDLLRFEVETAAIQALGDPLTQPSVGARVGQQQIAMPIPRP